MINCKNNNYIANPVPDVTFYVTLIHIYKYIMYNKLIL